MSMDQKIKNLRAALADLGQDTRQWTDEDLVSRVLSDGPSRLPEWARSGSVEDRLKPLRGRVGKDGLLSDTELLNQELNRAWAETRRHENAYTSLLQDRVKHDRAVRAAARQSAVADITAQAGLYLQAILRRNATPIDGVIYRAENLPEDGRARPTAVKELREAALRARFLLSGLSTESALADAAKDGGVQALEALKAELRRIQSVISVVGRRLHNEHGLTRGFRCECPGCELIRSVYDIGEVRDGTSA